MHSYFDFTSGKNTLEDVNKLEIEGRRKSYKGAKKVVPINPKVSFFTRNIDQMLGLVLCSEYEQSDCLVEESLAFALENYYIAANRFSEIDYFSGLSVLKLATFVGNTEQFDFFFSLVEKYCLNEKHNRTNFNYFFYKCLLALHNKEYSIAKQLVSENREKKGFVKFRLASSYEAIEALIAGDEQSFLFYVEKMRDEHSKKQKNSRNTENSLIEGVVPFDLLALLKLSQSTFGDDIIRKIPSRVSTFKYRPLNIYPIDDKVRGQFSVDHCFPLKFWNKPWVETLLSEQKISVTS